MHRFLRHRPWFLLLGLLLITASPLEAARTIGKLEAGDKVYYNVRVKEVLPDAIIILHQEGIAKVPLEDLPENLQRAFHYDPERAKAYRAYLAKQEEARRQQQAQEKAKRAKEQKAKNKPVTLADRMLPLFGSPPELQERVDLRPEFREMGFYAKSQGRRPSCAVFSVVSALEYQLGRNTGEPRRLSEEYLIWATRQSLGMSQIRMKDGGDMTGDEDLGFTLMEVVQALRAYGVADAEDLPNTFGASMAEIEEPPTETVEKARDRRRVEAYWVSGRTPEEQLDGIFHLLNNDVPVVIGLAWPNYAAVSRSPLIDDQTPRAGGRARRHPRGLQV